MGRDVPLTVGPWHLATIDDAPQGYFVRGIASSELGTVALGNREFGGSLKPAAWVSADGVSWERASFEKGARKGLLEAAVATPDGWVAVGREAPDGAHAWTSPDGRMWSAAERIQSAKGHIMYDLAVTPIGLVAVGCGVTDAHCDVGMAWVSQDGRRWEVLSELPVALPKAIVTVGDRIVVAGFSDGVETESSHAVTASTRDGSQWTMGAPSGPIASGFNDIATRADEVYAVGYQLGRRAADDLALLGRSPDGRSWTPVEASALEGWDGIGVATADELVLLVGTGNIDDFIAPITYASADLAAWTPGTFSEGLRAETYHVFDTAFTHAGDKAVMVGAIDYAPGIWWADVAPLGSPSVQPAATGPLGPITPSRFEAAVLPAGPAGTRVLDVMSGGPGFIAVGGSAPQGSSASALAWTSVDGMTWVDASVAEEDAADGIMEAVAALPEAGYVAVGRNGAGSEARVWLSTDGTIWEPVAASEAFADSVIHDVAGTPQGVVAVGCEAGERCSTGRVWTSMDGQAWGPAQELAMVPYAVAALDSIVAAGGTDDAARPGEGRAVIAIRDEDAWAVSEPLGRADSRVLAMATDRNALAAAAWQQRPGDPSETAVFFSEDGLSWDRFTHKRLRSVTPEAVGLSDDGLLLIGSRVDDQGTAVPLAFWTRDLTNLEFVRFPKDLDPDTTAVEGGAMATDGSMAFAVGSDGQRPAIWYSVIE